MLLPKPLKWVGRLAFTRTCCDPGGMRCDTLVSMMSHLLDWGLREYAGPAGRRGRPVFPIGGTMSRPALSIR